MDDTCTYQITVRGQVNENDINTVGPIQMTMVQVDTASTLFTVCTDQSSLVGLMRHLHGRGFVFLSVYRQN
jgi:hypothetical protein